MTTDPAERPFRPVVESVPQDQGLGLAWVDPDQGSPNPAGEVPRDRGVFGVGQGIAGRGQFFTVLTRTEARFAGQPGVALDFVTRRDGKGTVVHQTREYFTVRGNAAFVLGMGSATWEEHLPLIEQIAARFELTE